ncbi:MAG: rod-binding protein [Bdellovibrionales bacterium]
MKIQNGISLVPPSGETKAAQQDAHLRDAAKMYETHFLNEMVKAMRSTVHNEDGPMKPNFAEKIFSEQLDQQYVDGWANKGGVGLADMIYTQIRDKYYGADHKQIQGIKNMLPIAPQKDFKGIPSTDSIQMKTIPSQEPKKLGYRFEVQDSSNGAFEVQAPMAGKLASVERLDQGWNILKLDHGQGLQSEMTFPGQVTDSSLGRELIPGQRLGILDPSRPVLAWNLELG